MENGNNGRSGRGNFKRQTKREGDPEGLAVRLRDGESADSLIKRFKWMVEGSGLLRDLKEKEFAQSPSEKRKAKERKAAKRRRKNERNVNQ